jgi:hypothetical protein
VAKSIAVQLSISHELVGLINNEDVDIQKIAAKCVTKNQNADQNLHRYNSSEQHLECFRRDPNNFLFAVSTHGGNLIISL